MKPVSGIYRIALKLLMNDKSKFTALLVGITFAVFLMVMMMSMFSGILARSCAPVYNIPSTTGWSAYEFPVDAHRAGILSQISFLALHSHPARSSATKRGKALLSSGLHPHYVSVANTMAKFTGDALVHQAPTLDAATDIDAVVTSATVGSTFDWNIVNTGTSSGTGPGSESDTSELLRA